MKTIINLLLSMVMLPIPTLSPEITSLGMLFRQCMRSSHMKMLKTKKEMLQ